MDGNKKINAPEIGSNISFDPTNTFFARFEDVAIAFRILWDNAEGAKAALYNDGFEYKPSRESFNFKNNKGLRITLKHPDNGKLKIGMWWKVQEGINSDADFLKFRTSILEAKVSALEENGIADISVLTPSGKLGVKADLNKKQRLEYYLPVPLPKIFFLMQMEKNLANLSLKNIL